MKVKFCYCSADRLWHGIGFNYSFGTIALNFGFFAIDFYENLGFYALYFWRFSVDFIPKVKK